MHYLMLFLFSYPLDCVPVEHFLLVRQFLRLPKEELVQAESGGGGQSGMRSVQEAPMGKIGKAS